MAITTDHAYRFPEPTPITVTTKPVTYEDIMNAKRMLDEVSITTIPPQWKSAYNPYTKKEPTMKPLFQFTTVKPSAEVIWNTLSNHDISATSGYTVDEIRFYMFVVLQLRTDFKSAKELCNNYESRTAELSVATKDLLDLSELRTALRVPPADLPLWVDHMLYTPYYMLKQLGDVKGGLWGKLFDRETTAEMEDAHLLADLLPISDSITAYKLWHYGNDIIYEKYSDIFLIDKSLAPRYTVDKLHIEMYLKEDMYDQITDSDSHIYDYSYKIIIPQFTLGDPDASQ